jgi:hypothetical protein
MIAPGHVVGFTSQRTSFMEEWIQYFQGKYGKGPYLVQEVVSGAKGTPLVKLAVDPDIAWGEGWFHKKKSREKQ